MDVLGLYLYTYIDQTYFVCNNIIIKIEYFEFFVTCIGSQVRKYHKGIFCVYYVIDSYYCIFECARNLRNIHRCVRKYTLCCGHIGILFRRIYSVFIIWLRTPLCTWTFLWIRIYFCLIFVFLPTCEMIESINLRTDQAGSIFVCGLTRAGNSCLGASPRIKLDSYGRHTPPRNRSWFGFPATARACYRPWQARVVIQ